MKQYYIYIMTNKNNTVLYIGVTNDLIRRVYEHQNKLIQGFTSRYNLHKLVYYEIYNSIENAILREKELKAWRREKKDALINTMNEYWNDLTETLY